MGQHKNVWCKLKLFFYLYFCLKTKVSKNSRLESSAKNWYWLLKFPNSHGIKSFFFDSKSQPCSNNGNFLTDSISIFLTLLLPRSIKHYPFKSTRFLSSFFFAFKYKIQILHSFWEWSIFSFWPVLTFFVYLFTQK